MKRSIGIILTVSFLILLLAGCGGEEAAPSPAPGTPSATPLDIPFEASTIAPPGWEEQQTEQDSTILYYRKDLAEFFINAKKANKTIDEEIAEFKDFYERNYDYTAFEEPVEMTIDGHPAKSVKYAYIPTENANYVKMNIRTYLIIDGWLFNIICADLDEKEFRKSEADFQEMLSNVKIQPK